MGTPSIHLDFGQTLPFLYERFRQLIGKDQESAELHKWFSSLQKTAFLQAAHVQCIGMHRPLPISDIYQPTRLILPKSFGEQIKDFSDLYVHLNKAAVSITQTDTILVKSVHVDTFLRAEESAIIFAGPGWGKTTFLHHVFIRTLQERDKLPVLISLRRLSAVKDLEQFVVVASKIQKREKKLKVLLLVDGYDELPINERKRVSEAILRYQATDLGIFYVTCRNYYHVFDIAAVHARIDSFSEADQNRYVESFLRAFGSDLDPVSVVKDLHKRGFADFLAHPLLLALACIVKTSSTSIHSRSVIRLIEHAINVLTFRWDESKGVTRRSVTKLDGRDRITILKRLAFKLKSRHALNAQVLTITQEQLDRLHWDKLDAHEVLLDTARFFGILVPAEDGWEFVHRTLHDFLAAQFWVETGTFTSASKVEWDARTAYAACLTADATQIMEKALVDTDGGVEAFVEILSNEPNFDHKQIAEALIAFYSRGNPHHHFTRENNTITAHLEQDFIRLSSSKFLDFTFNLCIERRGPVSDTIAGYCLLELNQRGLKLEMNAYNRAVQHFRTKDFLFNILGVGVIRLDTLAPLK